MAYPFNFGSATSPVAMSNLDLMFNQVGAMIEIPCSASGTNAISLTPLTNCPALTSYNELGGYRFRAVGTSTGTVLPKEMLARLRVKALAVARQSR